MFQDDDRRQVMPNVLECVEHKASSPPLIAPALFVAQAGERLAREARNNSIHLWARSRIAVRDGAAQDGVGVVGFEILNRTPVDFVGPVWSKCSQMSECVTGHIDTGEIAEQVNLWVSVVV